MSLILDALRKMEQERKAKQGAAQDLRPEVLRYRSRIEPKRGRLPVIVSLFLVAVAVGAASFYIGKRDAGKYQLQHQASQEPGTPGTPSAQPVPVSPVEAPAAPVLQPSAALPPVAEPLPASPQLRRTTAATDAASSGTSGAGTLDSFIPVTSTSQRKQQAPTVGANRSSATIHAEKAAAARQAAVPVPVQEARARRREAIEVEQAAPADITISGIAFQDERHLRRAVVNGTLVGEGEEIAGARVVEIKEHKVRMSRGGKLFEVSYGSGGR